MADEENFKDRAKTTDFEEAKKKFEHLKNYVSEHEKKGIKFDFYPEPDRSLWKLQTADIIYPVGDPLFIHISKRVGEITKYNVIEPKLDDSLKEVYDSIIDRLVDIAYTEPVPDKVIEIGPVLIRLLDKIVIITNTKGKGIKKNLEGKLELTQPEYDSVKYFLLRNRVGYGKLETLFYDTHLEDIHCTGVGNISAVHKIFGMISTNIRFKDDLELNKYIIEVTERVERPASDAKAIIDAIMPDGSRVNFIYGREISQNGSSFTIRKFSKVPVSITQLIDWGTMSAQLAAYMWIALEHGMNVFVCGETASGKTTTLNALATFIKPEDKVYTVENVPEVTLPHEIWQHLVTREAGTDTDVTYQDLLIAALRSRPNYIIVGEIRGEEGSIAFQAMQTGHPVMSTFHAGNVTTMIQRLNGDPINIPLTFMDNLNLVLIQQAVFHDNRFVRRVLSLTELERYYEPANKVITREVFTWDSVTDLLVFRGLFNSYILEQKIAKVLGYSNPRKIYDELNTREKILKKLVENKVFDYYKVWAIIKNFHFGGVKTLPFKI